ncbi:MFS transporter [Paroceanicella profunda]|uniref:MFS transporter n=1 Tax=Paroceanicella profunda TaxID=2579971 RepID=A0A5B8FY85_9RHOB|nr:MFS transporter [Paroceanicella profunda]QDL91482.1 MFS transporter [Paroceanicella profunda]
MTWDTLPQADRDRISSWQWGMLILALACELFLAADWYGLAAVIPFISPDLGLNEEQAGTAQGIFALTYGIGMVGWSWLSRGMTARRMLLVGLLGTGIGMVLQVFVESYAQLLLLRLIIGFFDAAIFLGNMKLIFGWFPQRRHGFMVGLILAAYSLAITLVFALGVPLTLATNWRVFFGVLAAGTLIIAVLDLLLARNTPEEIGYRGFRWDTAPAPADPHSAPLLPIFRSRWLYVGGFGIAACTFAIAGTATWVIPGWITTQAMPVEDAGLIGMLMGLSQVVFLVIGGLMADRMSKPGMIIASAVMAVLVAIGFTLSMDMQVSFGAMLALAAVSGIAVIGGGAIFSLMSERFAAGIAPAAVGYAEIFGILSSAVAPALMGLIIHRSGGSFTTAFVAFIVIEVLFLGALVWLIRGAAADPAPGAGPMVSAE